MKLPYITWRVPGMAAAVAICIVVFSRNDSADRVFVLGNLMILLYVLIDLGLATSPKNISVERTTPATLPLHEVGAVTWTVRNNGRRRTKVGISDDLLPSLNAATRRAWVWLKPGESAVLSTTIKPSRRGVFEFESAVVRTLGPRRLIGRQRNIELKGGMRVYPPFRSKKQAELRVERARLAEIGSRSARARGGGTEFDQLREYGPDDDFRRVDWATTQRLGKPIVREYRAERNQTVLCLLDCGRVTAGLVGDVPRIEHAMDAVMALTAVTSRIGDKTGLVAFDSKVRKVVAPAAGRTQFGRVTEAMFALEPEFAESDYERAVTETLGRFRRRAMIVLFTELSPNAISETLMPVLPTLVRNHVVFVASVADPDVAAWAAGTPEDGAAAYRKAAAIAAITDRTRVAAMLKGAGVTVIDAKPGELAGALVDAYLRVKAMGRL